MNTARFALIVVILLIVGWAGYTQQPNDEAATMPTVDELLKSRVDTAQQCYLATKLAYDRGEHTLDVLLSVSEKQRDAELAMAKNAADKLAALNSHLERVTQIKSQIKKLADLQARGGERDKVLYTELACQDAQLMVLLAKGK